MTAVCAAHGYHEINAGADRMRLRQLGQVVALNGNLVGDELSVVPDPPDERRTAARQPRQPKKVDARFL